VVKKHIKSYLHSGHDVTNAKEIHAAILSFGGIRIVKVSVVDILPNEGHVKKIQFKNITQIHTR
jgi:hypothetical protein